MNDEIKEELATNPKETIKKLWQYLKRDKKKLIIITVLVIVTTILSVISPLLLGIAIDNYIGNGKIKGLLFLVICLAILYILTSLFRWLTNYIMVNVSETTLYRIRKDLFNHVESLPLSFFDKNKKGDLMSRFTNDITIIDDALTDAVTGIIGSAIMLIGVTIMMFVMNIILAITVIITVPVLFILVVKIGKKTGEYYSKQQAKLGELNSYAEEMISGMKVIKGCNNEEKMITGFSSHNDDLRDIAVKANLYASLIMPANMLIANMGNVLLIGVGAILIINNMATIGLILAFTNYASMFRNPINQLASLYASIQSALAGAERVFAIMDETIEILDEKEANTLNKIKGHVVFDNVSFSYVKDKPILKGINITAEKGENIALVGPTGAGKTTIINLLPRFYDIDSGNILIDNINIKNVKKNNLRSKIGIVLQDTYLFKGTVKDNIKYGNMMANDTDMIKASKKAGAHSFIHRLPNGYDSPVEEEGLNFSQGERQLISIARAILANPDILILDEATSNIDTRTEKVVQEGMKQLMKNRTSFVIAHRLSTVKDADKILVLNDGEIIEEGNHKKLLNDKGFYYKLYMSQFEE